MEDAVKFYAELLVWGDADDVFVCDVVVFFAVEAELVEPAYACVAPEKNLGRLDSLLRSELD
ncbi:MAG: hypothetical protein IMZ53_03200 [Thermoplasmata archaeon]|nr:hypothetical protein [Thermoplasmata archaeon]